MVQVAFAAARVVASPRKRPLVMQGPDDGLVKREQCPQRVDGQKAEINPVQVQYIGLLNGRMKR